MKMKFDYSDEVKRVSNEINKYKNCFKFVAIADSHLDNSLPTTLENISRVDKEVNFSCMLHLGDFINGNIPSEYTRIILRNQMEIFKSSISSKKFFPAQGNHDGYFKKHVHNIALNKDWYDLIAFVNEYEGAKLFADKPYYYVDDEKEKLRFVCLCSFSYTESEDGKRYRKNEYMDDEQLEWIEREALKVDKDYTVIIFSHDTPFALEFTPDNIIYNENGEKLFLTVKNSVNKYGFTLAGWFAGHQHGDFIGKVQGVNFIYVASNTAYVPSLWDMAGGGYYPKRELNTVTEDLWDTVVIDKEKRKLKLIRFGAGEDSEIDF